METGYEKLEIYTLSKSLAVRVHSMTLKLPKHEMYEEGAQIRRSSKSVPSNLVEGYCLRRHENEFLQYLHRSLASNEETLLHLRILRETGSLDDNTTFNELQAEYVKLGKMIFRFIQSIPLMHGKPFNAKERSTLYDANPTSHISDPEA